MTTIQAFHGSPGAPQDFDGLKLVLPQYKWLVAPRAGYPGSKADRGDKDTIELTPDCALGYSWGCFDCLEYAASHLVQSVILIAPYLYPQSSVSPLKRAVLSTPLLGDIVLLKSAPKAIQQMLHDSSYPKHIPPAYQSTANAYLNPRVLRTALLEKDGKLARLESALEQVSLKQIQVVLIRGTQDRTSRESEQIAPLRKKLRRLSEKSLTDGGHALLWTHPSELAKTISDKIERPWE